MDSSFPSSHLGHIRRNRTVGATTEAGSENPPPDVPTDPVTGLPAHLSRHSSLPHRVVRAHSPSSVPSVPSPVRNEVFSSSTRPYGTQSSSAHPVGASHAQRPANTPPAPDGDNQQQSLPPQRDASARFNLPLNAPRPSDDVISARTNSASAATFGNTAQKASQFLRSGSASALDRTSSAENSDRGSPLRSPVDGLGVWSPTVQDAAILGVSGTPPPNRRQTIDQSPASGSSNPSGHAPFLHTTTSLEAQQTLSNKFSALELNSQQETADPPTRAATFDAHRPANLKTLPKKPRRMSEDPNVSTTLGQSSTGSPSSSSSKRNTPLLAPLITNSDILSPTSSHRRAPDESENQIPEHAHPPYGNIGGVGGDITQHHQQSFVGNSNNFLPAGPASAAPYVPPLGHSHLKSLRANDSVDNVSPINHDEIFKSRGGFTAYPGAGEHWMSQKHFITGQNMHNHYPHNQMHMQHGPPPSTYAHPGVNSTFASSQMGAPYGQPPATMAQYQSGGDMTSQGQPNMAAPRHPVPANMQAYYNQNSFGPGFSAGPVISPVDINSLILQKGWNPTTFDCNPKSARFFVIKSYTEDDVHKSLKYEIWSSTNLGNKRLDKAFRESASEGPIYLFFSVNGSGYFSGVASMLTPVDETVSSNVWAQDSKWKGVFKVRWVFIRDVPNTALKHIRLSNTPENKPVTSSRDTQEVPYAAGCEILKLMYTYNAKTSLLQDFAFYDQQQMQKEMTLKQRPSPAPPAGGPQPSYHPVSTTGVTGSHPAQN